MDSNSVLDARNVSGGSATSHTIAAYSQRQSEARQERKIDDHKRACDGYDAAHAEFLQSIGAVTKGRGDRNAAGGAALAGLAIMALAGSTLLWWICFIVAVGCSTFAIREHLLLNEARDRCQTAIQAMYLEYGSAKRECKDGDYIPPRPTHTCS